MSFGGGPPLFGFKANNSPNKVFQSCQILNFTLSVYMVRPGRISWRRSLCQRNTGWSLSGPRAAGLQASWPPCFSCHVCHCAFDAFDAFVSGVARGNSCIWVECITSSCFIHIDVWAHFRFLETLCFWAAVLSSEAVLKYLTGTWLAIIAFWFLPRCQDFRWAPWHWLSADLALISSACGGYATVYSASFGPNRQINYLVYLRHFSCNGRGLQHRF